MSNQRPIVREITPPESLHCGANDAAHHVSDFDELKTVLAADQIQGNILAGFNKDYQMCLFLRIVDDSAEKTDVKRWLKSQIPFIATTEEVLAFNRLFKAVRRRRRCEGAVKATWVNIAFSYRALTLLAKDADKFKDESFKAGMAAQSRKGILGDPSDDDDLKGSPKNWEFGGREDNEADIVLIIASDDRGDLEKEVARIKKSIDPSSQTTIDQKPSPSGVQVIYPEPEAEPAAILTGSLRGHEHFGFLDGVSQPGIRGLLSKDPHDVLTLRQNPNDREGQGLPGQDLLWPGEFVFGYFGQKGDGKDIAEHTEEPIHAGPAWADNGSFLVIRRLRQDVNAFHTFVRKTAQLLQEECPNGSVTASLVGSRMVGRWPSGAPVERTPGADNPEMAGSNCANNNFEFQDATEPLPPRAAGPEYRFDCSDEFPTAQHHDQKGDKCPFSGHIRKVYPRDDVSLDRKQKLPNEVDTQKHRLLRRGIPFGTQSSSTLEAPVADNIDRGLMFLAYQTSIKNQFEFVTKNMVNDPDFKEPRGPAATDPPTALPAADKQGGGHDPIIGQNNQDPNRIREFTVTIPDPDNPTDSAKAKAYRVSTRDPNTGKGIEWVIPTGGGYFFAPSIDALENHLS
jgi:Dyp-type peroxidase family